MKSVDHGGQTIILPDPERIEQNEGYVRRGFWRKIKANLHRIPFAEDVVAAFYCALDADTPLKAKGVLLAALAYFIMPFDVIPDFLLIAGFTDDLAVLAVAIQTMRVNMTEAHFARARAWLAAEKGEADEEPVQGAMHPSA